MYKRIKSIYLYIYKSYPMRFVYLLYRFRLISHCHSKNKTELIDK